MYKTGLNQPTGPFPTANRAAFTLEIKPAATGLDAEVPATKPSLLSLTIRNKVPGMVISGYPRPVAT